MNNVLVENAEELLSHNKEYEKILYDIKEEKILKMENKLKDNAFYTQNEILKLIKETSYGD